MTFKPLLAAAVKEDQIDKLKFPLLASPKLDGIRVMVRDGVLVSRNLKPIRNKHCQKLFAKKEYEGFDGELIVGRPNDKEVFRSTSSGVMSEDGEPKVTFWVFDMIDKPEMDFNTRIGTLAELSNIWPKEVKLVPHVLVENIDDLNQYEQECVDFKFEGVMLRSLLGKYKNGRSTFNESILLKLKRFIREEAIIIGFKERMHNANEATTNALGHTERSTHKENMVPRGDLGALLVEHYKNNEMEFEIGTGFNDALRKEIWENQEKYLNSIVTFEHFQYGEYDKPRFPVFIGFRDPADMGE